jgi:hypothetical protein
MSSPNVDKNIDRTIAVRPPGPWLLVIGMHRSGTSAVAGALGALGFNTPRPDDRMDWPESNSEHWESLSLGLYNDTLLTDLGGSWEAPPDLPPTWAEYPTLSTEPDPAVLLKAAYPEPGARVWKDPRLCLLLPFWRPLLPSPLAAILIWRSPMAVADSLHRRDGMHLADGLALWERYNRSAITNLVGINTFVCSYESVLRDPTSAMSSVADWLSTLPQFSVEPGRWDRKGAGAAIVGSTPQRSDDGGSDLLLAQQHELGLCLSRLEGGHLPLEPTSLPSESCWTTALLSARSGSRTRDFQIQLENKQKELDQLRGSTSWRLTKPLRSAMAVLNSFGRTT